VILVCGEALIDLFAQFDDASGPTLKVTMGCSPLNVATGLVRLDTRAAGWSADHWGGSVPLLVQAGCTALGALVSMALHETAKNFFPRGGPHANAATEVAR
jgi:hypothetical protein